MNIKNMFKNDKFMTSMGIAFLISFLVGMTNMISKSYLLGYVPIVESLSHLFENFNACFYPSALAIVIIEWFNENRRLSKYLIISICVGFSAYMMAMLGIKIIEGLEVKIYFINEILNIVLGIYSCIHIILIYKILYKDGD